MQAIVACMTEQNGKLLEHLVKLQRAGAQDDAFESPSIAAALGSTSDAVRQNKRRLVEELGKFYETPAGRALLVHIRIPQKGTRPIITLQIPPPPLGAPLDVQPVAIAFRTVRFFPARTRTFHATTRGTVPVSISFQADWLIIMPDAGDQTSFTASVRPQRMKVGTYSTSVVVKSSETPLATQSVDVTLQILPVWPGVVLLLLFFAVLVDAMLQRPPLIDLAAGDPHRTFQPVMNLPWGVDETNEKKDYYGHDFSRANPPDQQGIRGLRGWDWDGVSTRRDQVRRAFQKLHVAGVRGVVWFLFGDGAAAPEFRNGQVTGLDATFWKDYRTAIDIARDETLWDPLRITGDRSRIAVLWTLVDFRWLDPEPPDSDADRRNGVIKGGHADVFEDEPKLQTFMRNALSPLLKEDQTRLFFFHRRNCPIIGFLTVNEPENAVEKEDISPEAMERFLHEAAARIKGGSPHPVSVGFRRVETMAKYAAKMPGDFGFFVTHLYDEQFQGEADEPFLPPPVDHLRKVSPGFGSKPVYIGEFRYSRPPLEDKRRLAKWIRALGYAGLWPWSLAELGPSAEREAGSFAAFVNEAKSATDWVEQFRTRRTAKMTAEFKAEMIQWLRHGRDVVVPRTAARIVAWEKKQQVHQDAVDENARFAGDKDSQIKEIETRQEQIPKELEKATTDAKRTKEAMDDKGRYIEVIKERLAEHDRQEQKEKAQRDSLRAKGLDASDTVKQLATVERFRVQDLAELNREQPLLDQLKLSLSRAENSIKDLESEKKRKETDRALAIKERDTKARPRQQRHAAYRDWYKDNIAWAKRVYLDFWTEELLWGNAAGLIGSGR